MNNNESFGFVELCNAINNIENKDGLTMLKDGICNIRIYDKLFDAISVLCMINTCEYMADAQLALKIADLLALNSNNEKYCDIYWKLHNTYMYYIAAFWRRNEFILHDEIKNNISRIFKRLIVVDKKYDRRHIPDLWVKDIITSVEYPVEMKMGVFDNKAKNQLLRYMKFYNTRGGIAIAQTLTCELPENIIFMGADLFKNSKLCSI